MDSHKKTEQAISLTSISIGSSSSETSDGFYNPYSGQEKRKAVRPRIEDRVSELDLARGVAITLMILSHTIKGLLSMDMIPTFGIVPIHLVTKFSSTLFFLIFGISLALFYLPRSLDSSWHIHRRRLFFRALEVGFWYNLLIIVQMFQVFPKEAILNTLLFQKSADFVEVLGFYSLVFLWVPPLLPFWAQSKHYQKALLFGGFVLAGHYAQLLDWGDHQTIKTLLFEDENAYTFGQVTRGWVVLLGLWIGELIARTYKKKNGPLFLTFSFFVASSICWLVLLFSTGTGLTKSIWDIAKNTGKHPPGLIFMAFSLGGAFLILGLCFWGGPRAARLFGFIRIIGESSLQAFIFHIVVIFVFYRWLFDLRHNVNYPQALGLTLFLILMTATWVWYLKWRRRSLSF